MEEQLFRIPEVANEPSSDMPWRSSSLCSSFDMSIILTAMPAMCRLLSFQLSYLLHSIRLLVDFNNKYATSGTVADTPLPIRRVQVLDPAAMIDRSFPNRPARPESLLFKLELYLHHPLSPLSMDFLSRDDKLGLRSQSQASLYFTPYFLSWLSPILYVLPVCDYPTLQTKLHVATYLYLLLISRATTLILVNEY